MSKVKAGDYVLIKCAGKYNNTIGTVTRAGVKGAYPVMVTIAEYMTLGFKENELLVINKEDNPELFI